MDTQTTGSSRVEVIERTQFGMYFEGRAKGLQSGVRERTKGQKKKLCEKWSVLGIKCIVKGDGIRECGSSRRG